MQIQMLNNAKAKGFWFKAFRGKRFRILKKEKKKLEEFKGLFRFRFRFLLWQNSDMTVAANALAAVKMAEAILKFKFVKGFYQKFGKKIIDITKKTQQIVV